MELYKKHRPSGLKGLYGIPETVKILQKMIGTNNVPRSILLTGPSGCGKTTIARILKTHLECSDMDFQEINCADFRGIDMVRDIRRCMNLKAMGGKCRIWLIDECHQLTKDAQNGLLKILEDTPSHVYFMLATTDEGKLLKTIQTRCSQIKTQALPPKAMMELLEKVCKKETLDVSEEVLEKIVEVAEGSARKALVLLDQVQHLDDEEERMNCLESADAKQEAINLARALINPRATWPEVSKILKGIQEEPEKIRHLVLAYATNVLLGGGKLSIRAYHIINSFQANFFDSKRAGLVAACFEVLHAK